MERSYAPLIGMLRRHGLRPTRQRLALARLLFAGADRHVSAESLHKEALDAGARVSLATVYNTLRQFTEAGLLREVSVDPDRSRFDTNTAEHHHLYFEETGRLEDLAPGTVRLLDLPNPPAGTRISRVDLIVRVVPEKR